MSPSRALRFSVLCALLLVLGACDDPETTDISTTSSLVSSATTVESGDTSGTSTTAPADGASPSTTLVGQSVAEYEVVARVSEPEGEILFITIPPAAYTDVDIENFAVGLVEDGTVTYGAEIFDDAAAVDAYRKPEAERTEEETQLISDHHFASIQNAGVVVFRGPFAASPDIIIGS